MSNYRTYAIKELKLAGYDANFEGETPNKWIAQDVLALLDIFYTQGHSGASASLLLKIFNSLAHFEPLTPLTGEESEWQDVGNGMQQNIRCSTIFKGRDVFDGQAYNLCGTVFIRPDGSTYTSIESRTPITFPYVPKTNYIKVE